MMEVVCLENAMKVVNVINSMNCKFKLGELEFGESHKLQTWMRMNVEEYIHAKLGDEWKMTNVSSKVLQTSNFQVMGRKIIHWALHLLNLIPMDSEGRDLWLKATSSLNGKNDPSKPKFSQISDKH